MVFTHIGHKEAVDNRQQLWGRLNYLYTYAHGSIHLQVRCVCYVTLSVA